MVHMTINQNNFSKGEINSSYYGRKDLSLYADGAKVLKNLDIQPSGSLKARDGLYVIEKFDKKPYIHKFITKNNTPYLLVFTKLSVFVYDVYSYKLVQTLDWDSKKYPVQSLNFAQGENVLFVCYRNSIVKKIIADPYTITGITRHNFSVEDWQVKSDENNHYLLPYERFADADITLQISKTGGKYYVNFSDDIGIYRSSFLGQRFYVNSKTTPFEIEVSNVDITSVYNAPDIVKIECKLISGRWNTTATSDWLEPIFSNARGWPSKACLHQGRLLFAASRYHSNRIWMSKTSDFEDFSLGDGQDDQAIDITLSHHSGTDIHHLLSGRHLKIFTASGEWVITNDIITPTNIEARQRTSVGSVRGGKMAPLNINGVTIFCDNTDYKLHEYTYTDIEDAYTVNSLSNLAPPINYGPYSMDYNKSERCLKIVSGDGKLHALWLFNEENVIGWSHYETACGDFLQYVNCGPYDFVVVRRTIFTGTGHYIFTHTVEIFRKGIFADGLHQAMPDENHADTVFSEIRRYDQITNYSQSSLDVPLTVNQFLINLPIEIYETHIHSLRDLNHVKRYNEAPDTNPQTALFDNLTQDTAGLDNTVLQPILSPITDAIGNNYRLLRIYLGLAIEVEIQTNVPNFKSKTSHSRYRLLQANFHVQDTPSIEVDSGLGFRKISLPSTQIAEQENNASGCIKVSGAGWKNTTSDDSIWHIRQYAHPNFNLTGVEMHLSVH